MFNLHLKIILVFNYLLLITACKDINNATNPLYLELAACDVYDTDNQSNHTEGIDYISLYSQPSKYNVFYISKQYDLMGKCIELPQNSLLIFNGGSIANGTIIGNNTRIVASNYKIYEKVKLKGSFVSDRILLSWWVSPEAFDHTHEVQSAMNSLMLFDNRVLTFDVHVRITDISFVLNWAPGVKFEGLCNSPQGNISILVYGENSKGLDISGSENLQFENLYFQGDETNPPKSLLYASRIIENKQCQGHTFDNIYFRGNVTESLVYNYAGELWSFNDCKFRLSDKADCHAAIYCTSINTPDLASNFGKTEQFITTLTCLSFERCWFYNPTESPSIYIEGGISDRKRQCNAASITIEKCYFYTPHSTSAYFKDIYGGIHINKCVDESGADSQCKAKSPFYSFAGTTTLNGLSITGNTFYSRKNSCIVNATCPVNNYYAYSNYIINAPGVWQFSNLSNANHFGLSVIEEFIVKGKRENICLNNFDYV